MGTGGKSQKTKKKKKAGIRPKNASKAGNRRKNKGGSWKKRTGWEWLREPDGGGKEEEGENVRRDQGGIKGRGVWEKNGGRWLRTTVGLCGKRKVINKTCGGGNERPKELERGLSARHRNKHQHGQEGTEDDLSNCSKGRGLRREGI